MCTLGKERPPVIDIDNGIHENIGVRPPIRRSTPDLTKMRRQRMSRLRQRSGAGARATGAQPHHGAQDGPAGYSGADADNFASLAAEADAFVRKTEDPLCARPPTLRSVQPNEAID
jgi:hypothetical protein